MEVLVLGAAKVGLHVAERLSEENQDVRQGRVATVSEPTNTGAEAVAFSADCDPEIAAQSPD